MDGMRNLDKVGSDHFAIPIVKGYLVFKMWFSDNETLPEIIKYCSHLFVSLKGEWDLTLMNDQIYVTEMQYI